MKDFHRDHPGFSQCGLNCLLCPMNLGGYCPGCGGGEGNQSCAVARCAMERNAGEFCSACPQFPCERLVKMGEYDSFLPHSRMFRDLERAEELGLESYMTQLEERRAILDRLLAGYNDGRRKSFYSLAACLLEPEDLRRAFDELQSVVTADMTVKEKAITAVEILKKAAQAGGVTLKLNKKPKEK
mgnify:CR=1 FL=1